MKPKEIKARRTAIHKRYGKSLKEYHRLMRKAERSRNGAFAKFMADLAKLESECSHQHKRLGAGSPQCVDCGHWFE